MIDETFRVLNFHLGKREWTLEEVWLFFASTSSPLHDWELLS